MRKKTSICHYCAGIIAALITLFVSIPIGITLVLLFTTLELWDAVRGHDSWWDLQEFILAFYLICTAMLAMCLFALLFGTPICEVCQ